MFQIPFVGNLLTQVMYFGQEAYGKSLSFLHLVSEQEFYDTIVDVIQENLVELTYSHL